MGRILGVRAVIGCMTNSQPKQYMMSVFCDISRAFDVIDHKIMLAKFKYYGFREIVKQCLSDYLSKRIQFVEFENYKSNNVILSGVLKGQYWGHFFI